MLLNLSSQASKQRSEYVPVDHFQESGKQMDIYQQLHTGCNLGRFITG
jgi:hypothetical protein